MRRCGGFLYTSWTPLPHKISPLCSKIFYDNYTRTDGYFGLLILKIRPFCCHLKYPARYGGSPFQASAVAKGITHQTLQAKSCANRDATRPYWKPRAKGIASLWTLAFFTDAALLCHLLVTPRSKIRNTWPYGISFEQCLHNFICISLVTTMFKIN